MTPPRVNADARPQARTISAPPDESAAEPKCASLVAATGGAHRPRRGSVSLTLGVGVYGVGPFGPAPMRPVLKPGAQVGALATPPAMMEPCASPAQRLATIALGYGDGYPRAGSNRGAAAFLAGPPSSTVEPCGKSRPSSSYWPLGRFARSVAPSAAASPATAGL